MSQLAPSARTVSSGRGIEWNVSTRKHEQAYSEAEPTTAEMMAMDLRVKWMQAMGLAEDEIQEYCDLSRYPANLDDELENVLAIERIKNLNEVRKQSAKK